jgi:hypothetical protein
MKIALPLESPCVAGFLGNEILASTRLGPKAR